MGNSRKYFADFKETAKEFIEIITTDKYIFCGIESETWNKEDKFEVLQENKEYRLCRDARFEGTIILKDDTKVDVDFYFDIENGIRRTIVGSIPYGKFYPRVYINGEKHYSVKKLKQILKKAKSLA
jgi:hypothetical protein